MNDDLKSPFCYIGDTAIRIEDIQGVELIKKRTDRQHFSTPDYTLYALFLMRFGTSIEVLIAGGTSALSDYRRLSELHHWPIVRRRHLDTRIP